MADEPKTGQITTVEQFQKALLDEQTKHDEELKKLKQDHDAEILKLKEEHVKEMKDLILNRGTQKLEVEQETDEQKLVKTITEKLKLRR